MEQKTNKTEKVNGTEILNTSAYFVNETNPIRNKKAMHFMQKRYQLPNLILYQMICQRNILKNTSCFPNKFNKF